MAVVRWIFNDPVLNESYTVHINPNEMGSLFPQKRITSKTTTAIDGKVLVFESKAAPVDWQFSGFLLQPEHHDKLHEWVYDRNYRIRITDHFGRIITCYLTSFTPTPKRSLQHYWRHDYTIQAIVFDVGPPTVFDYQ